MANSNKYDALLTTDSEQVILGTRIAAVERTTTFHSYSLDSQRISFPSILTGIEMVECVRFIADAHLPTASSRYEYILKPKEMTTNRKSSPNKGII